MVRIANQDIDDQNDRQSTTTRVFVARSSTPLVKTMCTNCIAEYKGTSVLNGDPAAVGSQSFYKWEKKLQRPINYQVDKAKDYSIFYTVPVGFKDHRRSGKEAKVKKFPNPLCGPLFQDPAIMGIKRGAGGDHYAEYYDQPPPATRAHAIARNGIEFIKNFKLIFRHRQCSNIEANLKDTAQQRHQGNYHHHPDNHHHLQRQLQGQLPVYGGH